MFMPHYTSCLAFFIRDTVWSNLALLVLIMVERKIYEICLLRKL